jgi:hypothetical protein
VKIKKKTAEAVASSGGQKYINKKLTVFNLNTSHRVGQDIFPRLTGVYSENQKKENQCFGCLNWFDWLPFGAVKTDAALRGVYVGICGGCINSLSILPPSLQKRFWQKVETNLKNTLGVKAE